MKIEIKGDDHESIFLSNENLDNDNFVEITITEDRNNDDATVMFATIPLDDLSSAVTTFLTLRNLRQNKTYENK
jgi:hypothetical protein